MPRSVLGLSMNAIEIPIASAESCFEQENEAFGQNFICEFEWIEREAFWMLHIFGDHQIPLALGIKLQSDWPLKPMTLFRETSL